MEPLTVRQTLNYTLQPTAEQEATLAFVVRRCRARYHAALTERRDAWRMRRVGITLAAQRAQLPALKAVRPDYRAIHAQGLQEVLTRLDRAFQAYFRRVTAGETPGYPRFEGTTRYDSCTDKQFGNGAALDHGYLVLATIGRSAVRWSRPVQGSIKTVTVSRAADGWHVCCSCAEVPPEPLPLTGRETGIEMGLKVFLVTAAGDSVETPRHYRTAAQGLTKAQKRGSHRKKGSNRRRKAAAQCAKQHQQVRRQRSDVHHKTTRALVRQDDVRYVEAIQAANLRRRPEPKPDGNGGYAHNRASRKAGLNKSIHDAGWRRFLSSLADKAAGAGKRVEAVSPAYTSQQCSGCGAIIQKALSVRTHVCTTCGLILDRAENAARNSFWRGQRLRGVVA